MKSNVIRISVVGLLLVLSNNLLAKDLFIITKNKNPKNVLYYKANIKDCKFLTPAVSPYWVLGEEDNRTEDITESEASYFAPTISYQTENDVEFTVGVLNRLGSRLPNKTISIHLENCIPKAYMEFSSGEMLIQEIKARVNALFSVKQITFKGLSISGEQVTENFSL